MERTLICIFQYIGICLIFMECLYIFMHWKTRRHSLLFLYCLATLINNIGYLLEITAGSSEAALVGTKVCYLGKVFISLSLFLFVLNICKVHVSKILIVIMSLFHIFIFTLVLTCRMHTLYYTSIVYVPDGLFPHNQMGHGSFYYIFASLMLNALGIHADLAASGGTALKFIEQKTYQMIFVDYMMPEMDGVDTTKAIRKLAGRSNFCEYCRDIPIIALTGDLSDETRDAFLDAGANDIIEKPLGLDALSRLLEKYL